MILSLFLGFMVDLCSRKGGFGRKWWICPRTKGLSTSTAVVDGIEIYATKA